MRPTLAIPALESLATQGRDDIARLLQAAYKLGRDDMRRELMTLLSPSHHSDDIAAVGPLPDNNIALGNVFAKAPRGTVKPAILDLITNSDGLLTDQIISQTGFKENSVRGTLSALAKEGKISREDGRWFKKTEAPLSENKEAP